jgi:heptosyltransferase-3
MYKVYPENLRTSLLKKLDKLGVPIIVTGGKSKIDLNIKKELPSLTNLYDFIGQTSLEDFMVLSKFSIGYIGMDTLNMHIAASQNKRIFAIFGPTNLKMWSPWSNTLKESASIDAPIQDYANITIFQADMPCVACGKAGCDDNGISLCLEQINPKVIFDSVKEWYESR